MGRFVSQRTLRARVAALGDSLDAIDLQTRLAKGLLDLDRPGIEVFFVDDHFVTNSGGAPLAKGWNTKRRHAEPGHSDTWLADAAGRPLICMSGEPTGLTAGLIKILQPLRHIVGNPARPLVAFDRGGSYPDAFKALHTAGFDWVAFRTCGATPRQSARPSMPTSRSLAILRQTSRVSSSSGSGTVPGGGCCRRGRAKKRRLSKRSSSTSASRNWHTIRNAAGNSSATMSLALLWATSWRSWQRRSIL